MPADKPRTPSRQKKRQSFYSQWLDPDLAAALEGASGGLDLADEIKLIRLVAGWLGSNLPANHPHVVRTIGVLCRAVALQARAAGNTSELEEVLRAAAERILAEQEQAL
ncbi:MAG TPA: hypothetical protein VKX16_12045 [Chloroflexota bacterium]|nr:hypothetical protein [Chloroflexota bacterium]